MEVIVRNVCVFLKSLVVSEVGVTFNIGQHRWICSITYSMEVIVRNVCVLQKPEVGVAFKIDQRFRHRWLCSITYSMEVIVRNVYRNTSEVGVAF